MCVCVRERGCGARSTRERGFREAEGTRERKRGGERVRSEEERGLGSIEVVFRVVSWFMPWKHGALCSYLEVEAMCVPARG